MGDRETAAPVTAPPKAAFTYAWRTLPYLFVCAALAASLVSRFRWKRMYREVRESREVLNAFLSKLDVTFNVSGAKLEPYLPDVAGLDQCRLQGMLLVCEGSGDCTYLSEWKDGAFLLLSEECGGRQYRRLGNANGVIGHARSADTCPTQAFSVKFENVHGTLFGATGGCPPGEGNCQAVHKTYQLSAQTTGPKCTNVDWTNAGSSGEVNTFNGCVTHVHGEQPTVVLYDDYRKADKNPGGMGWQCTKVAGITHIAVVGYKCDWMVSGSHNPNIYPIYSKMSDDTYADDDW
jgi:hypothetical protein